MNFKIKFTSVIQNQLILSSKLESTTTFTSALTIKVYAVGLLGQITQRELKRLEELGMTDQLLNLMSSMFIIIHFLENQISDKIQTLKKWLSTVT